MSYCVNCGVELAKSEKYCPLCNTEVINPRSPWKEPGNKPYPLAFDTIMRGIDKRYVASLISIFFAVPVAVTILCDLLSGGGITWSVYVFGAAAVLFVWVSIPLYSKRYHRLTFLFADCMAVTLYLLSIDLLTDQSWFWPIGLPISAAAAFFLLALAYLFRKGRGRHMLARVALVLISTGIFTILVEIVLDLNFQHHIFLNWSPFVLIPCIVLAAATQVVEQRKNLKEEIRKRLFY